MRRRLLLLILVPLGCSLNPKGELPSANDPTSGVPGEASSEPQPATPIDPPPTGAGPAGPDGEIIGEGDEVETPCPAAEPEERDAGAVGQGDAAADPSMGDAASAESGDAGSLPEVVAPSPCGAR